MGMHRGGSRLQGTAEMMARNDVDSGGYQQIQAGVANAAGKLDSDVQENQKDADRQTWF